LDVDKNGAAVTRQRALDGVYTKWVAFLDDDDYLYPNHIETLLNLVHEHEADVAYSWFTGNNPFPMHRGRQFNPAEPHHTTMTLLVRTELAQAVKFATDHPEGWILPQEDWRFILGCSAAGGKFIGTGDVTWHYRCHANNTSGLAARW
jgi:glycosyltransferase involved in cell wall biosynthesis